MMDDLKRLRSLIFRYIQLTLDYAKFTAAEKFTLLSGMLVLGIVCLAVLAFCFIFLGFSCAELFKLFMAPALAYLATAGVFLIFAIIVILLREPLILTPISRLITRILLSRKTPNDN